MTNSVLLHFLHVILYIELCFELDSVLTGLTVDDIDVFEINEAFASQVSGKF